MKSFQTNIDLILLCESHKKSPHMRMDGNIVDCQSESCASDLRDRIRDTAYTRDSSSTRSDERSYYNGVLRVLRRRLREVENHLKKEGQLTESKKRSLRRSTSESSRLMKLAGIL
jgi:hypothetical protein